MLNQWEERDDTRPPSLYNLSVADVPYLHCMLAFPHDLRFGWNVWGTYLQARDIGIAPVGRNEPFQICVHGVVEEVPNQLPLINL